jgi:hypothetical protein
MFGMFAGATSFNQNLSRWCVESIGGVTVPAFMFKSSPLESNNTYHPPFNDDEKNAVNCN